VDLVIVESPAKARTIEGYLGKGFKVLSSFGHVRDLPKSKLGVDTDNNYQLTYRMLKQSKGPVSKIKQAFKSADTLYLATDLDREGEAIAWHLAQALKLKPGSKKVKRIVFDQVTKTAIKKAINNPRKIDEDLVDAQQARRVLDRLVGYKLSPFLWEKVTRGLSAGRVQSVAVRLIVDRERKIKAFKPVKYWQIIAQLKKDQAVFLAKLDKVDDKKVNRLAVNSQKMADQIDRDLQGSKWKVKKVYTQEKTKHPFPPYNTASLQRDAAHRLGFTAKKTMFVAQRLYEGIKLKKGESKGLITYMRTDSFHLANDAITKAREYIKGKYPQDLPEKPVVFRTKSKGAQEAHEAIRPTNPGLSPDQVKASLDKDQFRLYQLIWQRVIASQMNPIKYHHLKVEIEVNKYGFLAEGLKVVKPGFGNVYNVNLKETELPGLKESDQLDLKELQIDAKETKPLARYNESSLVKELEKQGIGRPSTYAAIISTIQARNYVEKIEKYFHPTEIGIVVNDILVEHFPDIVDYQFTAAVESDLDSIALGKKKWVKVIDDFYKPFEKNLIEKSKSIKKQDTQEKMAEKCPDCGNGLVKKFGRFGKFIACSNYPDCKYSRPIKNQKKQNQLTAQEKVLADKALKEIPNCEKCKSKMVVKKGRFGIFLGCSGFPKCKNMVSINQTTGQSCPECKKGEVVIKRTKRGKIFWGCTKYPDCDWASWTKPK